MIIARTERLLAAAATAAGIAAWIAFLRADLVLSHYDARAHLVVARRVIDNITPGWQQIGAVWLPLPHLIHLLPAQVDVLYRTGAFASLVSIACSGVTAYAAARLIMLVTGSPLGAAVSTALLALNPNLLYLQATPMTEPLLIAVTFLAVLWLYEWTLTNDDAVPAKLRWTLFAAAWTRYEAWLVIGAALPAALFASLKGRPDQPSRFALRRSAGAVRESGPPSQRWLVGSRSDPTLAEAEGRPLQFPVRSIVRRAWNLGIWPAAAVVIFLINSRITVGTWFVTGGFFVPDPAYQGQTARSLLAVWWGTHQLSTRTTEVVALAAAAVCIGRALTRRADAALLLPVTLFAVAPLPFYAFYEGHPFRIRYMIPLVAACALFGGLGVGMLHRPAKAGHYVRYAALVLAGLLLGITLLQSPPWRQDAPMLVEAQWDVPASQARRGVTECLTRDYRGERILASMGSLAHYMQELSRDGLAIADFVHEGNGVIWQFALETGPAPHAGWMLVEEQAEGGDVLAQRIRQDPTFARGMARMCEGGGVALYRRE